MADLNMSVKLPAIEPANHFAPKTPIQSQTLQNTQKTEAKDNLEPEKQKRQELASAQRPGINNRTAREELDDTVSQLNNSLQNIQRNLEFSVDKDVGKIVINVKDKETDEVVRQIPSEEVLELAKNLHAANERLKERIESRSQSQSYAEGEGVFLKTKV